MRGSTHLILGAAVAAPFAATAHAPALVAVGALAALLPDLDHPGSMIGRWLPWPAAIAPGGNGFVRHGRRWFGGHVIWHRGEVHSLGAGLIAAASAAALADALHLGPWLPALCLFATVLAAWCSHLAADLVNRSPIMLLWPLKRRMVRVWRGLPEGSFLETLAELAAAAGAVWLSLPDVRVLLAGLRGGAI